MNKRKTHNYPLNLIVSEFEEKMDNGVVDYMNENTLFQLIDYYDQDFRMNHALEVVDIAKQQYPFNPEFYVIEARLLIKENKFEEAHRSIEYAKMHTPYDIEVQLLSAQVLALQCQTDEALQIIEQIKNTSSQTDLLDTLFSEAIIYEIMKDFEKMFYTLKQALFINPNNHEALEKMWVSVELSKKYEESIIFHEELLEKDPYSYLAWYNLGHAYSCIGEYKKAIESIEYSFLINESFEAGYRDCAELCLHIKNYKKALNIFEKALDVIGEECDIYVCIAECHIFLGQFAKAKSHLMKALKLDPFNDEIFYYLGECFASNNEWKRAIKLYTKAIEIEDRREEYFGALAHAYSCIHEYTKADFYFRKATETGPEQELYWSMHAKFLINIDAFDSALEVIEEAFHCTVSSEHDYLKAVCYFKLKQRKKALKVLELALEDNFELHDLLFDVMPSLKEDRDIHFMLKYYKAEAISLS